jgi:hypothetical protein
MKRCLILGLILVALVAISLAFSLKEESTAGENGGFKGTALCGRTVTACVLPGRLLCYQDVASAQNRYSIPIPSFQTGGYELDDGTGCQLRSSYYDGSWVTEDFCVPPPYCPCW